MILFGLNVMFRSREAAERSVRLSRLINQDGDVETRRRVFLLIGGPFMILGGVFFILKGQGIV